MNFIASVSKKAEQTLSTRYTVQGSFIAERLYLLIVNPSLKDRI